MSSEPTLISNFNHQPSSPISKVQTPITPITPKSNDVQKLTINRSISTSPSSTTTPQSPVVAIASYIKHLFGLNAKTTKRSLSEEAECGSPESLSEWLRQGSDPNEVDAYGYTPLVNASLRGCIQSVTILINNGADLNKQAMHGYTPLHAAAQNGFCEIVELLIDNGANMEIQNDDGDTPLMLAVRSEHAAIVDLLCKRGCNMHTHGFDNMEPINYALNRGNLYLSDVLMKHEQQNLMSHENLKTINTNKQDVSQEAINNSTTSTQFNNSSNNIDIQRPNMDD